MRSSERGAEARADLAHTAMSMRTWPFFYVQRDMLELEESGG